jgi:DNA-binding response OmpR family regulator
MEAYRTTPAIFMTAKVQPNEIQGYLDMGAVDVIAKPFDPMTLAAQISKMWIRTQD